MQRSGILVCHWNGRFGNRMHQYAFASEYSRVFGVDCILPSDWEGTRIFEPCHHQVVRDDELRLLLNQSQPALNNLGARSRAIDAYNARSRSSFEYLNPDDPRENWAGKRAVFIDSVCAYHASIFERMSATYLRNNVFVFSEEVRETEFFKRFSERRGTYDVAHLRRDDIANPSYNKSHEQGYSVLSKQSYVRAFRQFGFDPERIEWISDDYLGKWHCERNPVARGGWTYPVGSEYMGPNVIFDWLCDFLQLYFARTIFRANSSFSWWAAFLSQTAEVYSPVVNRRSIYGRDSHEEVDFTFVKGNHPHWMFGCSDIRFLDEVPRPKRRWPGIGEQRNGKLA